MFKAMIFVRRRSGLSMADFMDYYETRHAVIAQRKVSNLRSYVRYYLTPYGNGAYPADGVGEFDAVVEIAFESEGEFERGMAMLSDPETQALIAADEEHLFERSATRFFTVAERASSID